jgi:adenylate kinase
MCLQIHTTWWNMFLIVQVCQAVSKVLSMGQTVAVPAAELLKSGKIKQYQCDLLTCDLRMTPSIIKEQMKIRWLAEKGLAECAAEIIEEFRLLRHLKPIKLAVLGPPFSGKTSMAKRLSQFYAINYLNVSFFILKNKTIL